MPKKDNFERDTVDIRISRKCHEYLKRTKQRGEAFYHIVDTIVGAYKDDEEARVWEEMYYNQVRITQDIMAKNKILEDKINRILNVGMQTTLV